MAGSTADIWVPAGTVVNAASGVLGSGPAVAGSATVGENLGAADVLRVVVNVTAISGTTPSLQLFLEDLLDPGPPFWGLVWQPAAITATGITTATLAHTVAETSTLKPAWGNTARLRYTFGGTTPSATIGVYAVTRNLSAGG